MNQTKYKICKLNEVAWFQEGPGVRKSQFRTSGVKLLNVGNICDRELVLDKTSIYVSEEEAYGKYKHFLVDEGDLLIASSGIKVDYFDKKITFARKEHLPLCMNTSTIRFKVLDKTQLDIHYLRHFLASRYFTKQVQFHITGSAQLNFGPSHLNKMTMILPPLEEQKKIAKILDKADEIRAKKKLANDKLDEFLKSTFISMFGDTVVNPKKWNIEPLNQYIDFMTSGSRGWAKYYSEQGEIFIRIGNVRNAELDLSDIQYVNAPNNKEAERTKVKTNDLLISITADLGRTAVIDEATAMKGAYINQHLCLVRLKDANPVYIAHYMQNEFCKRQIKQLDQVGVKSGLNFEAIKNLKIIVPPIEQQNKFAQIVEKVEAQKQKNEQVIEQMDNLFNSLSQKAFKGDL